MKHNHIIEALRKVERSEAIHPNTARSLISGNLIAPTESGYRLLDDGKAMLGAKFVLQQATHDKENLWENIGAGYASRKDAEDAARLRSVTDEADYRVLLEDSDPAQYAVYSYGIRYVQNQHGLRTRETVIVKSQGDDDEPMHLYALERNQGAGWQRFEDRRFKSSGDADQAAATASRAKIGDYRTVIDDCPLLPPAMWRGGKRLPNIHLLEEMALILGDQRELIRPLVQAWTGEQ